ncbi:anaerobic benzoate catabolism transcriptional regulator [Blastochloris viridis]|uniref:Anaerobic benzoate catabolism transcriptional regulator n=2 Tax=Blastochloris viridis TaxID=1079 RepID=A0A0H5BJ38_BLAVI|nr:anaerobic benzoate catabolism transcriptional regulator [Blastochloris viridis]BAS00452.1 DNA-binding protein [Blastochloris viridis]CUU42323.1 anaerobic benzoate catabolism transcriptional regulator [Blastochloris viridis]
MPRLSRDPQDIEVGRRIRARRLELGLSLNALAVQLELTFQQVQKYESGANRVAASRLMRIAEALHVPPSFFFPPTQESLDTNFEFLTSARALLLARAFAQIRCENTQAAIVSLVEQIAKAQADAERSN